MVGRGCSSFNDSELQKVGGKHLQIEGSRDGQGGWGISKLKGLGAGKLLRNLFGRGWESINVHRFKGLGSRLARGNGKLARAFADIDCLGEGARREHSKTLECGVHARDHCAHSRLSRGGGGRATISNDAARFNIVPFVLKHFVSESAHSKS